MKIRLEKPTHRIISKLTGAKSEKPRRGYLKRKTSVILIVCLKEIIP